MKRKSERSTLDIKKKLQEKYIQVHSNLFTGKINELLRENSNSRKKLIYKYKLANQKKSLKIIRNCIANGYQPNHTLPKLLLSTLKQFYRF